MESTDNKARNPLCPPYLCVLCGPASVRAVGFGDRPGVMRTATATSGDFHAVFSGRTVVRPDLERTFPFICCHPTMICSDGVWSTTNVICGKACIGCGPSSNLATDGCSGLCVEREGSFHCAEDPCSSADVPDVPLSCACAGSLCGGGVCTLSDELGSVTCGP